MTGAAKITEVECGGVTFRLGDTVYRRGGWSTSAKIETFYTDVNGGCILDREIDGYRSWNVAELTKTRRK